METKTMKKILLLIFSFITCLSFSQKTFTITYEPVTIASVEYPKYNITYSGGEFDGVKEFHSTDGVVTGDEHAGYKNTATNTTASGEMLPEFGTTPYQVLRINSGGTALEFAGSVTGTNTGDNATNTQYSGLVSNAIHTGDVTGSTTLTIADKAVTLSKIADMTTSSLVYRKTAGAGAPEINTLATLKTDLGLTGTNSGDQTISDATISTTDITTNNATSSKHGFLPKLSNVSTEVLSGIGTWITPSGSGDMILANSQTITGAKTFNDTKFLLRNVANTFNGSFVNTNTADRVYTLKDASGTLAFTTDITGTNSGTNTGDQTSVSGNAGTATTLETPRTINGTSFNGSANIIVSGSTEGASIVTASAGINTTETIIVKTPALPANRLVVGSVVRVTLIGSCTSTAANVSTFKIRIGTNGTTADGVMQSAATSVAATSGTNIPFKIVFEFIVRTTGASATSHGYCTLMNTAATGIIALAGANAIILPTFTNFNTTTANNIISCTYVSAATTTTCTFQDAFIEIVYK